LNKTYLIALNALKLFLDKYPDSKPNAERSILYCVYCRLATKLWTQT